MKLKNIALASALLAVTCGAIAAPQVDFNVEAVIPDNNFYVTPLNGWDGQTQKMGWNEASLSLSDLNLQMKMKNSTGGIKAYLNGQPALTSSASVDVIDLDIKIAGKPLPLTAAAAVELYTATEAAVEKTATMTVSQKTKGARPAAGTYMGAVTMIFDTVPKS